MTPRGMEPGGVVSKGSRSERQVMSVSLLRL